MAIAYRFRAINNFSPVSSERPRLPPTFYEVDILYECEAYTILRQVHSTQKVKATK